MQIQIINPIDYPNWDDLLLETPGYSFFHTAAWAKVLNESYQYTPVYFTAFENGNLIGLMPVMDIRSFLTGHRGVSLPFTDMCEPIISNDIQFDEMFNYAISYGRGNWWKSLELRCGQNFFPHSLASVVYFGHELDITPSEEHIFANFRKGTKSAIKKAITNNVVINISHSLESLKEFYRLNCFTRKKHGLPPQPFIFFKNVYDYILSKNLGVITLASYQNHTIAGSLYIHFGEKVMYKYAASDTRYQHLRPNNLIMWETIKWYCRKGFKTLCLGRTDLDTAGLQTFKRGWGTTERDIYYYKYNLQTDAFNKDSKKISSLSNKILRKTPIPILKLIGSLLYKHMG